MQEGIWDITLDKSNFNSFYCYVDEHGTIVTCWVENYLVFCVESLYKVDNTVNLMRRRSRKTISNRRHIDELRVMKLIYIYISAATKVDILYSKIWCWSITLCIFIFHWEWYSYKAIKSYSIFLYSSSNTFWSTLKPFVSYFFLQINNPPSVHTLDKIRYTQFGNWWVQDLTTILFRTLVEVYVLSLLYLNLHQID